jgi:enolase
MTIRRVTARRIWDSRGRPTIEVEVETPTAIGRGIAPAGASRGTARRWSGAMAARGWAAWTCSEACRASNARSRRLVGREVADQAGIDAALSPWTARRTSRAWAATR